MAVRADFILDSSIERRLLGFNPHDRYDLSRKDPMPLISRLIVLLCAGATFVISPIAIALDRGVVYESRYMLAGFLLRASTVCQGNKHDIDVAFSLLNPDELKAFSKSFPDTTAGWMKHGADNFNNQVMKDGIPAACSFALDVLRKAEEMSKSDR